MALVLADLGAATILDAFFNNSWPAGGKDLTLKLYTNDYTPLDTSTAGSFTEAAGGGYATKTLSNGSWTQSQVSNIEQVAYAQQTITFTGALNGSATVYGYFVVDADGVLVYGERFATAFQPTSNGDAIKVTPLFQMSKGTPA